MSHTVRTTLNPDVEIEVDDAEFVDLQRLGVLFDEPKSTRRASAPSAEKES